jgi:hypothetical protein
MQAEDVADVARRTAALLDNANQSRITQAYLMPYIDQEFGELDNELEALNAPYVLEQVVLAGVAPGTSSLASYMQPGGQLADMKVPSDIWWKQAGQPDIQYSQSTGPVGRLDFTTPDNIGAWQWTFLGGMLAVTPSGGAVDLQVTYQKLSTNIVDPQTGVILGTASLLAVRVAFFVATLRGMPIAAILEKKQAAAARNFKMALTKPKQGVPVMAPKTHGRLARPSPVGYI